MRYRSKRDEESTCGRCGRKTYRSLDAFFPECSDGCAEWMVDRHIEEKHGIYSDDDYRW